MPHVGQSQSFKVIKCKFNTALINIFRQTADHMTTRNVKEDACTHTQIIITATLQLPTTLLTFLFLLQLFCFGLSLSLAALINCISQPQQEVVFSNRSYDKPRVCV